MDLFTRIAAKISPEPNSGCWLWTGCLGSHGYGQVRVLSGTTIVHRILYEQKYGLVPQGLELDHLCRVRCCVNPDHLEPVTRRENILRGIAPSAKQARQTHCMHGHKFTFTNTYVYRTKWGVARKCKICTSIRKGTPK
jgi:hypothetical protein